MYNYIRNKNNRRNKNIKTIKHPDFNVLVTINEQAYYKLLRVFNVFLDENLEVGAYIKGNIEKNENIIEIIIEDFIIPEQQIVTSTTFNFSSEAEASVFNLQFDNKIIGLIHTHNRMQPSFSNIDEDIAEKNIDREDAMFISIIFSFNKTKTIPQYDVQYDARLYYNYKGHKIYYNVSNIVLEDLCEVEDIDPFDLKQKILNYTVLNTKKQDNTIPLDFDTVMYLLKIYYGYESNDAKEIKEVYDKINQLKHDSRQIDILYDILHILVYH